MCYYIYYYGELPGEDGLDESFVLVSSLLLSYVNIICIGTIIIVYY